MIFGIRRLTIKRVLKVIMAQSNQQISSLTNGPFNYINGVKVGVSNAKKSIPVVQPSNGKILFEMPCSNVESVCDAVDAASIAFPAWSKLSGFERGICLRAIAKKIRENQEEIAELEVLDTGKPIWEARSDISCCADTYDYFSGVAATIHGTHHKLSNGSFAEVHRDPLGVVCGIGAWNYPFQVMSWKACPALAAGNTFVFKPSEVTPLSAIYLAQLMTQAGLPNGVVNVVQGDGETGELLCQNKDVSKVTFTGSVPTGKKIMALCARGMKRVTMELGGKSPLIVFPDSDLEEAVKATLLGNFLTQGEVCTNCSRVFVHKSIIEDFTRLLVESTNRMVIGDPMDAGTTVGATISEQHAQKVLPTARLCI